jgi:hypothetical protein
MDCMTEWHSQHLLDVLNSSTRMTGRVAVSSQRMKGLKTGVHLSPLRARLPWELAPRATTDPGGARSSRMPPIFLSRTCSHRASWVRRLMQ